MNMQNIYLSLKFLGKKSFKPKKNKFIIAIKEKI